MVLKKGRRRSLTEAEEDEGAQQIVQPIPFEECWSDFFTQEFFHRLPANQLQAIKSVCRNWFRAISSPNFVGLHLKIYNESRIRVVVKNEGRAIEYRFNIIEEETKQLPCLCPPEIRSSISVLGSCDGLLCLHFECSSRSIGFYNPSTGNYFRPKSSLKDTTNYYISCSWFGHHPCSGEYVLVLGNFDDEIGVYKFNRTSNFELIHSTSCSVDPHVYFNFHERIGTLLHGAIHWPAQRIPQRRQVIYAYHLDDNKYLEISPPVQPLRHFNLGVAHGCLFAFLRPTNATNAQAVCEFEMRIMKKYGVEESWIKYTNIRGLNSFDYLHCHSDVVPLGFFPNGDLILDVDRYQLIKYSFNDNKAELLTHRKYGNAILCADSLMSPTVVGT